MTSYWLSLDAAGTIKYGKGYHMEQTMLLQHCLKGQPLPPWRNHVLLLHFVLCPCRPT